MTDPTQTTEPKLSPTAKKIASYADLPVGWNYGNGGPPAPHIIAIAISAEKMLREAGYPETDSFSGGEGEIKVTGYRDRKCIEVNICEEPY